MKRLSAIAIVALAGTMTLSSPLSTHAATKYYPSVKGNNNTYYYSDLSNDQIKEILDRYGISWNDYLNGCTPEISQPETQEPETNPPETDVPEAEQPVTDAPETEKPGETEVSYAQQVVNLVNKERAKQGLQALTLDTQIAAAANVRANEIQQSFSHTRPNGSSFNTVLNEMNISYTGAGENIAWGQTSPEKVMEAWMNSPGHKANILNKKYTKIGVGYQQNAKGTNYWVQIFAY